MRRRRVPIIRQVVETECGLACLAMVLSYHGRSTTLTQCRDRDAIGRDGMSARAMLDAARAEGLEAVALRVGATALGTVELPAVLHWKFRHFVVLERWTPQRVTIVDPSQGRRELAADEFARSYSGIALTFRPGPAFRTRAPDPRHSWWAYLRGILDTAESRQLLASVVVASALLQAFGLGMPLLTMVAVDRLIPGTNHPPPSLLALGLAALVLSRSGTGLLRAWLLARLQRALDIRTAMRFFLHLLRLPYAYFQQRTTGDLLVRMSSNGVIREVLTSQVIGMCLDGPLALGFLATLVALSPRLALLVLAVGAVQAIGLTWSIRRQQELSQRAVSARSEEQGCAVEVLGGIAYVKASASEEQVAARWKRLFQSQVSIAYEAAMFNARLDAVLGALRFAAPLLLLWLGAVEVIAGRLTVGEMMAASALASSFLGPLMSLVQAAQQLQTVAVYIDRVSDVLDAQPERAGGRAPVPAVPAPAVPAPMMRPHIECRNVWFRFSAESPWVLQDVSLRIERGMRVGIVGATGSGKSTLAMVLLGLLEPKEGLVLHDGIPLAELDLQAVRRQCSVVMQDPQLFGGTLHQNVALRDPDASRDAVAAAVRAAALDADVAAMPLGYETHIGERGALLSGGQRQRVAIARALLGRPGLLVLDEATSHLDARTEARIQENLAAIGCTTIMIAHRLQTVRDADRIIVMDAGRLIEMGEPRELLERRGAYWALVHHVPLRPAPHEHDAVPA